MRMKMKNTLHSYIHSGLYQTINKTKRNRKNRSKKSRRRRKYY